MAYEIKRFGFEYLEIDGRPSRRSRRGSLGLLWEWKLTDPEPSLAYCEAYNRWIADFCRDSGGRLIPKDLRGNSNARCATAARAPG